MKYLIIAIILLLNNNQSFGQKAFNLTGKSFEYTDRYTNAIEQYTFLSNSKVKLVMKSVVNGKAFEDVCNCQCTIEGNKIKLSCSCEDKEIYPSPLKETFIYNKEKNTLTTTIHYDQNKKPRVFTLTDNQ